jgi:hypothetical protein
MRNSNFGKLAVLAVMGSLVLTLSPLAAAESDAVRAIRCGIRSFPGCDGVEICVGASLSPIAGLV